MKNNGGVACWSSMVSDNTGNTHSGRRLAAEELPTVFNLADCIHMIHNTAKEMSFCIEYFKEVGSWSFQSANHHTDKFPVYYAA